MVLINALPSESRNSTISMLKTELTLFMHCFFLLLHHHQPHHTYLSKTVLTFLNHISLFLRVRSIEFFPIFKSKQESGTCIELIIKFVGLSRINIYNLISTLHGHAGDRQIILALALLASYLLVFFYLEVSENEIHKLRINVSNYSIFLFLFLFSSYFLQI